MGIIQCIYTERWYVQNILINYLVIAGWGVGECIDKKIYLKNILVKLILEM